MSKSNFLGWIFRQRFISRWSRMDNLTQSDVSLHSHCLTVSVVAHLLAEINNRIFNADMNCEKVALLGLYHECAEGASSDLPSLVKYATPTITREIKKMEDEIERMCAKSLPEPLQAIFGSYIIQKDIEPEYKEIVKAADDIVAWFKCKEEVEKAKNVDFADALVNLASKVEKHKARMPCVDWFLHNFNPGYRKTIDQLMAEG